MKSRNIMLSVVGLLTLVFAPMLIVDSYRSSKANQENNRATFVKSIVRQKIEAYQQANGHYPDSFNQLSFTNSPQDREIEADLSHISYSRTPQGYMIGWHGTYVQSTGR